MEKRKEYVIKCSFIDQKKNYKGHCVCVVGDMPEEAAAPTHLSANMAIPPPPSPSSLKLRNETKALVGYLLRDYVH